MKSDCCNAGVRVEGKGITHWYSCSVCLLQCNLAKEKAVSAIKKGYRTEKKCYDELKNKGYILWKTHRAKYINLDMFGLFDVVALHPEGSCIRFIQCKTNRCDKPTRVAIQNLKMPMGCTKEIWIWYDYKGWKKFIYGETNECKKIKQESKEAGCFVEQGTK